MYIHYDESLETYSLKTGIIKRYQWTLVLFIKVFEVPAGKVGQKTNVRNKDGKKRSFHQLL